MCGRGLRCEGAAPPSLPKALAGRSNHFKQKFFRSHRHRRWFYCVTIKGLKITEKASALKADACIFGPVLRPGYRLLCFLLLRRSLEQFIRTSTPDSMPPAWREKSATLLLYHTLCELSIKSVIFRAKLFWGRRPKAKCSLSRSACHRLSRQTPPLYL